MEERRIEWTEAIGGHGFGLPDRVFLTRRDLVRCVSAATVALGALRAVPAHAQAPVDSDGTLQAFADTMVPGRRVATTVSGAAIHPQAIAGVDPEPGAVEADALAPPFLAELTARSLAHGGPFLDLPWDGRVAVCIEGLAYDNPTRLLWEAAAAVPFTAFCAAALEPQTAAAAPGYRVMGLPGAAPHGYRSGYSYRRRLARERTRTGSLP